TRHVWVYDQNERTSHLAPTGYHYPGMELERDDFTPMEGVAGIALVDRKDGHRGGSFSLPADFPDLIRLYTELSAERRARFERACYWLHHATENAYTSRAAATIALVSAIESLNPPAAQRTRCPECNQIVGATRTFQELMERLAPGYDAA